MDYICYECFVTPLEGDAEARLTNKQLILCPRDPRYWAVTQTHLRCLYCDTCVVVDLHVRLWYATPAANTTEPRLPLAA
jgi:hypothetical protein